MAFKEAGTPGPYYSERNVPGYIDKTGAYIIKPETEVTPAGDFSEGLAVVRIGEKYGYVDKTGTVVIEPRFDEANGFSEGLAVRGVKIDTGSAPSGLPMKAVSGTAISTRPGNTSSNRSSIKQGHFSDGLAPVCMGEKWGYIDKNGTVVITPAFYWADEFSDGMAVVTTREGGSGWSYIDTAGTLVVDPFKYDELRKFSEGLAAVRGQSGKWGYVDKKGTPVIALTFVAAGDFSEGLAAAGRDGKWGYIDKTGNFVLVPQFETLSVLIGDFLRRPGGGAGGREIRLHRQDGRVRH